MSVDQLHLSLSEAVPEPVARESDRFSDSGSDEHPGSQAEAWEGSELTEDVGRGEVDAEGNPGWADAMAKVLRTNKPKRKRSIVLSKARRIQDLPADKRRAVPVSDGGETVATDTHPEPRKLKKVWENKGRVKPDVLDRNRERTLSKIATKGVVQLFNAVRDHRKTLDSRISQAGNSELKREKILKSVDKKAFLDILEGACKTEPTTQDDPESKPTTWKVLREDFMMGAKLKDWDKDPREEQDEDTER